MHRNGLISHMSKNWLYQCLLCSMGMHMQETPTPTYPKDVWEDVSIIKQSMSLGGSFNSMSEALLL